MTMLLIESIPLLSLTGIISTPVNNNNNNNRAVPAA